MANEATSAETFPSSDSFKKRIKKVPEPLFFFNGPQEDHEPNLDGSYLSAPVSGTPYTPRVSKPSHPEPVTEGKTQQFFENTPTFVRSTIADQESIGAMSMADSLDEDDDDVGSLHSPNAFSITSSNKRRPRKSTRDLIVALSEQRRSTAAAAMVSETERKRLSQIAKQRKSILQPSDQTDPLSASMQLFRECCGLVRRNKRQLCFNSFLVLLVCMILTSMIVFAFFAPAAPTFEIVLTSWCTFWPLQRRLTIYQPGTDIQPLILSLGEREPRMRPPSYCKCCDSADAPCEEHAGRCWCFKWANRARLYVSLLERRPEADCLILEWRNSSLLYTDVTSCVMHSSSRFWYGGVLKADHHWPLNATEDYWPNFELYTTNDPQSEPTGSYGAAQPTWISNDGYSVMVSLDYPFEVRQAKEGVCFRSSQFLNGRLRFAVCKASDPRLYTLNSSSFNDYISPKTSDITKSDQTLTPDKSKLFGTILISKDSASIHSNHLIQLLQKAETSKQSLGVVFEKYDLFNLTMQKDLSVALKETRGALNGTVVEWPPFMVEINNFVHYSHLEAPGGHDLEQQCLKQTKKKVTGMTRWRDGNYACLDLTRRAVFDWFLERCKEDLIVQDMDFLTVAGGDAFSLPWMTDLNVTYHQLNFYTLQYTLLAKQLPKSFSTDVGYGDQPSDLYLNLATSPYHIRSLIPLMLSLSLQGFSRITLTLVNYTIPGDWWRGNSDPLYTWLELAMFTPVFRIPESVLDWTAFDTIDMRFRPLREPVILKHYRRALKMHIENNQPVFKPIWWRDYARFRSNLNGAEVQKIWMNDRQFMIGDDLVVAAFLQVDEMEQMVYLPPGRWRNPEAQQGVLEGGQYVYIATGQNVACFERIA